MPASVMLEIKVRTYKVLGKSSNINSCSPRGYDALLWPLQALHICGTQTRHTGKISIHIKENKNKKGKFLLKI